MSRDIRILVVDESLNECRITIALLNELGYASVQEADDGNTALSMLRAGTVDVLIADWNVPGIAGIDLLRATRTEEKLAKIPVLLLTAEATREQIMEAAQAGVNGYAIKPLTARVLKDKLDKILHSQATTR